MSDRHWRSSAVCAQVDREIFFPKKGKQGTDAKRICRGCPVRPECLEYALRPTKYTITGVWGGLSERERRNLLTRSNREKKKEVA